MYLKYNFSQKLSIVLVLVGVCGGLFAASASMQLLIEDEFDFPMTNPTSKIGYDIQNASLSGTIDCFDEDWSQLYHAGEDWFAADGTAVTAVADGKVVYVHSGNYPGNVIILEHILSDGSTVYSMYGHLKYDDGSIPGRGYTYPNHPDYFPGRCERYHDPTEYVDTPRTGYCLVLLPLIFKSEATPVPTATPTPLPDCYVDRTLVDDSFEDGDPFSGDGTDLAHPFPWERDNNAMATPPYIPFPVKPEKVGIGGVRTESNLLG